MKPHSIQTLLAALAFAPSAYAQIPSYPPTGALTSTVKSSITLAGSEIPAFDPVSKRAFASSGGGIQVVDLTNPTLPTPLATILPSALGVAGLTSNDVSSIAVRKGTGGNPSILAAAIINLPKTGNGHVVFLNAGTGALLGSTAVGAVPDHIAFTPDGTKLLVCNEGELYVTPAIPATTTTPAIPAVPAVVGSETVPGTVSVVDLTNLATPLVATAGFASFNSSAAALKTAGVRIFNGGTPEFDFEPEYLAISPDGTKAMVTLQEANAVAILDIASATFTSVLPLGEKDFFGIYADFSDRDGSGNTALKNLTTGNPVFGLYMPDAIASYRVGGQTYYVTANEGDDRDDFLNPAETIRVGTTANTAYDLDNAAFPAEATLKTNARLARLTVINTPGLRGDTDGDGDIDRILKLGGRSFSILDSSGARVFDSGDMIEVIASTLLSTAVFDDRSDNKGPEPEGVTIAKIGARTFAFVGLERAHMTLAFDVTNPLAPTYAAAFQNPGDLNPEGMVFVEAGDSPSGKPLLLVSSEVSNTLTVFEIGQPTDFKLQLLHLADAEAGLLAASTAPNLAALVDAFDGTYPNTLILAGGDNYIPGPFAAAGTDAAVAALSIHSRGNNPFAADIEIHNRIGV
ncbi:MAG: choice-of-anchor I family protein, partial [Luteolibacter sp.]